MLKRSATILAAIALAPLVLAAGSPGCGGGAGGVVPEEEEEETAETEAIAPVGVLDETFGDAGTTVTDIAGLNDRALGVAVQDDGKIVVCGQTSAGSDADFLVIRYASDGTVDTKIVTRISSEDECAFGIKVDSLGRLVVAGWVKIDGVSKPVVARYQSDGTLDDGFGASGFAIPTVEDEEAGFYALELQSDGKIVAAGQAHFDGMSRILVTRFNEDGSPDSGFGDGSGVASATFGSPMPWSSGGKALAIDAKGRMVAAGWVVTSGGQGTDFALARFDADGRLDATFNSSGLVHVDLGNNREDHVYGLAFQGEKILAVGNTNNGADKDLAIVRLLENGSVDGEEITLDYSASTELFGEVIVGKDQEVYVGGTITLSTPTAHFAVIGFDKDLQLNSAFGTGGFLLTAVEGKQSNSLHMTRQKDGKLVQVGTLTTSSTNTDVAVARYR